MNTMEKLILHIRIKAAAILGRLYPLDMRGVGGGKVKITLFFVAMLISCSFSFAQGLVSGVVKDSESSEALPGVNVLKKGTTLGTVTDVNGAFQINAAPEDVLVFSFIGYTSQEVAVGTQTSINVSFKADITELQEVVVTGYTEQRKRDIVGAVAVVDAEQLKTNKAANFGQMLTGRAAGVTTSTSGEPGGGVNIRIRGVSSFTNNDPMIIIDGVQIQGDKAINGLNPNDIESMQVLKDAGSASIYGARASSGVVIITTKQGKAGKIKLTYDGYIGTQAAVKGYNDFLIKDPADYAKIQVARNPSAAAFYNNNLTIPTYFFPTNSDGSPLTGGVDESTYVPYTATSGGNLIMKSNPQGTDWWDETFRTDAIITDHNIGLTGGTENATFNASAEYFKQEGTMIYTGFERFSARLNSRFTIGKFKFGESLSFSRTTGVNLPGGNQNEQNNMTQILKLNSIVPVYDIGGNFAGAKTVGFSNGRNPVAVAWRNKDNEFQNYKLFGSFFAELSLTKWLKARTNFGVDYGTSFTPTFLYPAWEVREVNSTVSFSENWNQNLNYTFTNLLEADKTFGKHTVKAFVGYEANKRNNRMIFGQLLGYSVTDLSDRYLNQALGKFNDIRSSQTTGTILSLFAKLDYEFNDKYLVSATVRRDGSSSFVQDKYGVFPAVSVGYRISSEPFMQSASSWLSDLKIRGGWGRMGNQTLPANRPYNTYDQYGTRTPHDAAYDLDGTNTTSVAGLAQTDIGNKTTSWETNTTTNIGFDISLFDGKFSAVLDVYSKDITDLLYNAPLPGSAGNANTPASNVAHMTNKGYDIMLGYKGRITPDLSINVDWNLSQYKNNIKALDGTAKLIFPTGVDKRFGEVNAWLVGEPISSFYGYQLDGIFQNQAEVDALAQTGAAIGRFRWKDLNGDGKITDDDKGPIGNPHPKLTTGLNIGLMYKQFDFAMFLFGSFGNKIYNYNKLFTIFGQFASNVDKAVLTDAWSPENPGGTIPKLDGEDTFSNTSSSFYVENGSYVRATNITLGYTLPTFSKIGLQKLRVYVQAQNLFTITEYDGIDPAVSSVNVGMRDMNGAGQNDGWAGFDFGNYPASRAFMVGVNATF